VAGTSTLMGVMSLAEYVRSLGEGDCCPCCGGTLRAGSAARVSDILRCSACGCELEAEERPFPAVADQGFELAA
jgi:hypothetical protein